MLRENELDRPNEGVQAATNVPRISVVLATYNRLDLLKRLLGCLARQTFDPSRFEVIVVDDGSKEPVRLDARDYPFALTLIRQVNAGPSAARHRGVLEARGDILVLLDDDMDLPPRFLETHLSYHDSGPPTAVMGRYVSDPMIHEKPAFERYTGLKWDQLTAGVANGTIPVDGTMLATGNASMRREDYLRVGGLDLSLKRAEDMDLGLALEAAGVHLVYSETAYSVHMSDHTRPAMWRARAFLHGTLEPRIARKHPHMAHADPWRYAFSLPASGRLFCAVIVLSPAVGEKLVDLAFHAALGAEKVGFEQAAMRATGLVYGMEYFRGMRVEAGSLGASMRSCVDFLAKAADSPRPLRGVPRWLASVARRFARA